MVRQKAKTYGNRSRIEGGDVKGLNILLLEDHISTGLSCLDAIRALREEGAEVTQVMSITNYAIPETMRLFAEQGILWLVCVIPALLLLLAMFIISKYELTDEVIDKINREIEKRSN